MNEQMALLEISEASLVYQPNDWSNMVVSLQYDEQHLITDILNLHNRGQGVDLDPTYSTGRFWFGLPQPKIKGDIAPDRLGTIDNVIAMDAQHLALPDACISSIMFDPPFVEGNSQCPGVIRDRFSCFKSIAMLWEFYYNALLDFYRVLVYNGIVIVKCQDTVSGGVNYMSHVKVINLAQQIGFYVKDLFVLGSTSVMWSPNMARQDHARKTHSYYVILVKRNKTVEKALVI